MNVFGDLKLNNKTNVYLQIIQHIKCKVLNKNIVAYTPLPSRRELASLLPIGPNTVQKLYKPMEGEGVLRIIGNMKSVVYTNEQIMERLQQEITQETVGDFIASYRECGSSFQKVAAIPNTRQNI